jgi:hypothetical protein
MVPKDKGKAMKGKKPSAQEAEWIKLRESHAFFPLGYTNLEGVRKLRVAVAAEGNENGATVLTPTSP